MPKPSQQAHNATDQWVSSMLSQQVLHSLIVAILTSLQKGCQKRQVMTPATAPNIGSNDTDVKQVP